ncbi:MAG: phosphatase PAP2 family protein [Lachnospiraceae bacterium]
MGDYAAWYRKITAGIRTRKHAVQALHALNKVLTAVMYAAYPALVLAYLIRGGIRACAPFVLIPGISFVLLSLVRRKINRKRPYETWDLDPLIAKKTKGNSMPSRHVFSCAVISMCLLKSSLPLGIAGFVITALSALVRVLGGVHYPEDTLVGGAVGILAGLLLWLT